MKNVSLATIAIAILGLALAPTTGCGGSVSHAPEESRADRLAASLDAAERRLETERATFDGLDPAACVDRCRSSTAICDASEEICGIARELGDPRSQERCLRAQETCSTTRELVTGGGCACEAAAGT